MTHEILKGSLKRQSKLTGKAGHGVRGYQVLGYWPLQETEGQGAELVVNGGFETYTTSPGVPDGWTSVGVAADDGSTGITRAKETATIFEGLNALRVTADWTLAPLSKVQGVRQLPILTAGRSYRFKARYRVVALPASGGVVVCKIHNATDSVEVIRATVVTTGTWHEVEDSFYVDGADRYLVEVGVWKTDGSGATGTSDVIFDSISLTEIEALDTSVNTNHGTLRGAVNKPGPTIGAVGPNAAYPKAYSFDGVDDHVLTPYVYRGLPEWTIGAWALPTTALVPDSNRNIIGTARGNNINAGIIQRSDLKLTFYDLDTNNGINSAANVLVLDGWNRVAAAFKDGMIFLYCNGALVASGAADLSTGVNAGLIVGGAETLSGGLNRNFQGPVAGGFVVDRALSIEAQERIFTYGPDGVI